MKLSDFEKNYVFTTRIDLSEDGKEFVELREPNQQEFSGFGDDGKKNLEQMEKIFPSCVIASSFVDDEEKPADGKSVYNALKKSGSIFTEVLSVWLNSIPFQHRLNGKNGNQASR